MNRSYAELLGHWFGVRAYLNTAPRWILCLLYGLPFGAIMSIGILWDHWSDPLEIILFGLVAGLLYGALVTFATEKPRREVRALIGEVPRDEWSTVFRAARRGPAPADPELRAAALRLNRHDAAKARLGVWMTLPFVVLMIAAVVFKPDGRPQWSVLAVLAVVGVGYQWMSSRRLDRRAELLTVADDRPADRTGPVGERS
ncbi:hypothetical protein BWI15_11355 [Kribbella sp. ALI-6-A]|uniref:hypothetical protein n=1 Tax=Kribbella sp. ALI-6-A TaxID=1933817 RepID=UPI00097BCE84|nr:hypothetical protein [Kribbella sp. ALI-6-A]ONI73980.1 hypothetical protein BWI15_11355 [Kribbella sp. ALI-6-A]